MTKQFGVPILIDERVAEFLHSQMPPSEGRCRMIAKVQCNPLAVLADAYWRDVKNGLQFVELCYEISRREPSRLLQFADVS